MRRAERIVHVDIAELRERARETLLVLLLAAEEARVLEQQHRSGRGAVVARSASSLSVVSTKHTGFRRSVCRWRATGSSVYFDIRLALGPAEVREQHHDGAACEQRLDGGKRGADARVVGDAIASRSER